LRIGKGIVVRASIHIFGLFPDQKKKPNKVWGGTTEKAGMMGAEEVVTTELEPHHCVFPTLFLFIFFFPQGKRKKKKEDGTSPFQQKAFLSKNWL